MRLGCAISGMDKVICTLGVCDGVERGGDGVADGLARAGLVAAQVMLELGEELLDRVEVGGVFGQEEQLGADPAQGLTHGLGLVRAERSPFSRVGASTC